MARGRPNCATGYIRLYGATTEQVAGTAGGFKWGHAFTDGNGRTGQ